MHPRPQKALVTGSAGFVGRALVWELARRGFDVSELDVLAGQDVRDPDLVAQAVPERGIVFHLAGVVGVANVLREPRATWTTAVAGTAAICRVALERGTRVVLTSSSEVYGDGEGDLLREDRSLPSSYGAWPRASYPESKRIAEQLVHDLTARGGDGRIARLFNVAGPGQLSSGGMVLPTFVEHALAGTALPVVGDGSDVRCFQHVADAARGIVALGCAEGARGLLVNLGGAEPVTMRALAERVIRALGSNSQLGTVTSRARYGAATTRCRHRVPDTARARELLGHVASRGLEQIIGDTARHHARTTTLGVTGAGPSSPRAQCAASPATLAS